MIAQQYLDMLGGKSVIRQLSEWSTARGAEIGYENVFDYSLGNPSVPCPPQFTQAMLRLLQNGDPVALHGYSPTLTIPSVRAAVAENLRRRFGVPYTADHIFMTTGAAGALAHALRCVAVPGQSILTIAPYFPEYKPYVEGAGLTLRVVPPRMEDFQIDFAALESMLDESTAAVLINTRCGLQRRDSARPGRLPAGRFRPVRPPHFPAFGRTLPGDRLRRRLPDAPRRFLRGHPHLLFLQQEPVPAR